MEESWKSCFEEELLCPICLNVFDEPVQLPCKHNFCQSCISEAWAKESAAGGVRCPECNHEYGQKPSLLEKNIKLANIVERYNSLNTEKPVAALHCVLCRRGPPLPVQKVCLRCKEPCCQSHIQTHLQQPSPAPGHLLVDVEELRAWTCPRHDEYRLLHCHDEHAAVCQFCCISRCAGQRHAVCDVDTQRAEMQHVLMRHQERLDARVQNIDEQLCKLESDKILVKDAVGQLKERVRSQYQRMHAVLDADLSETVKLLDSVHGAYRQRNSQQALRLKERQQEADRLLSTAQVFCHRAEDINFMKNTKPYQLLLDRSKAYLGSSLPPHKVGQLNSHLLLSELTKREQSLRKVLEEPFRDSSVLQVVPSSQSGAPEPEKRKHGVAFPGEESNPGPSGGGASQDHLLHASAGGKRPFLGGGGDPRGGGLYPPVEALSQAAPHPGGLPSPGGPGGHHHHHHVLDSSAQQRLAALGAGASSRHSGGSLFPPAPPHYPAVPTGGPHYPAAPNGGPHSQQQSMLPPQYGGRKILVCSLDNCYCSRAPPPPPPPPPHGRGAAPYPLSESFPWGVGSQEYPPPHQGALSSGQPALSMREWMEPSQSPRHHPDFYRLYGQSPLSIL